jgi:S-DNA-T family DNA segregation ATPase FtsK/SpoIIIE
LASYSANRDSADLIWEHVTVCSSCDCGFSYDDVAPQAISERLPQVVDELCEEVAREQDTILRRRPAPEVWSPLEYCCHLRDVLITQRERVVRALVEDCPTVPPMHRDERAVLTRYADEQPRRVLDQLRMAADMAAWTFASLDASQWMRSCVYNYPEPTTRSLEWVGRHTLHEAVHHLVDVRRILGR